MMSPYLETYLAAHDGGQRYFRSKFYGQGRPHLNFDDLKATPVPVPPVGQREVLMDILATHGATETRLKDALREATSKANLMKRSLMAAAFTGKLASQEDPLISLETPLLELDAG